MDSLIRVALVASVISICVRVPVKADSGLLCSTQEVSSRAAASIVNYRNLTGHWFIKVILEQDKNPRSRPWTAHIDQQSLQCDEAGKTLTTATFTVPPPLPGADYALHAGIGYYKFHPYGKNWAQARDICAQEGSHLAVLNSAKEAEIAKQLFVPFPKISGSDHPLYAWLGAQERGALNFYTIFGEPLNVTGFNLWSPGEPDDAVDGCVTLHRHTGKLTDAGCGINLAFICEQEL